ncbi:hypothetical protein BKA65DRAFT_540888 [Rhexocercosporidium sp. MPI-PUGE-AT-0058]|nr:hypothetical protein BKA65DRAFT_540888 [Rhexocercosporidium sp. MPI-PUGE-AT-0058]
MTDLFPLFPLLPKELRLAIWNLALESRIVELCFQVWDEEWETGDGNEDGSETENGELEHKRDDPPGVIKEAGDVDEDEDEDQEAETEATNKENDNDNDNNSDGDSDSESETSHTPLKPGHFYSPTALPSLLRVNSEARSVALAASLPGFPMSSNKEDEYVYYNPEIDILFFPAWCWQHDISGFEERVGKEVKGRIRRVALENLMWMSFWDEGTVNDQITISEFKNVKEFIFATRELTECGCCIDFGGPEVGLVEFVEIGDEDEDEKEATKVAEEGSTPLVGEKDANSETEMNNSNDQVSLTREMKGLGVEGNGEEVDKRGKFDYTKGYMDRLVVEFQKIKEADEDWNVPEARFVRLKRGGEFARDP